ncbi:hypothetical protein, conserved [Eimeria maxima]|uniref:Transmembrane protein n=1 Tax=Eimeria maxima TaxID=5804 RepID=U6MCY0_EIMMA|nr:hypothetical protein, conserved [Eimeria maxima]CDJ60319.1 hypothetical protein, conserved [Eimeria maxima]
MQSPCGINDFPISLPYGPCGDGTPASFTKETQGSMTPPFRSPRASFRSYPRHMVAALLPVLVFVAISLYHFRLCRGWARRGNVPRLLADNWQPLVEDLTLSAILDMCLDMEEEVGNPLVSPQTQKQTGPPDQHDAQFLPYRGPGLQEITASQTWWTREPPLSSPPPNDPQFLTKEPIIQGNYDSRRDTVAVWGTRKLEEELPSTSFGKFSLQAPCVGFPLSNAAARDTSSGASGVSDAFSQPQYRHLPDFLSRPCLHPSSGVVPPVSLTASVAPGGPAVYQQQQLFRPYINLTSSPPLQAAMPRKRHLAQVEVSDPLGPHSIFKRLKGRIASLEANQNPLSGLAEQVASQMVPLHRRFELAHSSEADDADRLLKAVQAVPLQWLPPPLGHSSFNTYSDTDVLDLSVSSRLPKESAEPNDLASVPRQRLSFDSSEGLQRPSCTCVGRITRDSSGTVPGAEASHSHSGNLQQASVISHPFYRLPKLETGARLKEFSVRDAFEYSKTLRVHEPLLHYIRSSLVKDTLSEDEANGVLRISERLVSHLYHFQATAVSTLRPSNAVSVLGRRYLMLDALAGAVQVLGPPMRAREWWQKLVGAVQSRVVLFPSVYRDERARAYAALAVRLSTAIDVLKQGIRPDASETVSLKRDLLCREVCHPEFRRPPYDPWRRDDMDAGGDQKR